MSLPFVKTGAAADAAFKKEKAEQETRREQLKNQVFRYRIPVGAERKITFLDGDVNADGVLNKIIVLEHNVQMRGKWGNHFICTDHGGDGAEPCPLCEGGNNRYQVGFFTVIDHSKYTDSKGQERQWQIRLFAAKSATLERLQMIAGKRGGLAGCTFDVSRSSDKTAACGDVFDFVTKNDPAKVVAYAQSKGFDWVTGPIDYEKMLASMWKSAKDLRALGFGSGMPQATDTGSAPAFESQDAGDDELDGLL